MCVLNWYCPDATDPVQKITELCGNGTVSGRTFWLCKYGPFKLSGVGLQKLYIIIQCPKRLSFANVVYVGVCFYTLTVYETLVGLG